MIHLSEGGKKPLALLTHIIAIKHNLSVLCTFFTLLTKPKLLVEFVLCKVEKTPESLCREELSRSSKIQNKVLLGKQKQNKKKTLK